MACIVVEVRVVVVIIIVPYPSEWCQRKHTTINSCGCGCVKTPLEVYLSKTRSSSILFVEVVWCIGIARCRQWMIHTMQLQRSLLAQMLWYVLTYCSWRASAVELLPLSSSCNKSKWHWLWYCRSQVIVLVLHFVVLHFLYLRFQLTMFVIDGAGCQVQCW